MSNPDILVVGAGIAGLHTALAAAPSGLQIRIIDKQEIPPSTIHCGEGIMTRDAVAMGWLHMGRPGKPSDIRVIDPILGKCIESYIKRLVVVAPDGTEASFEHPGGFWSGFVIDKAQYLHDLACMVNEFENVEIIEQCPFDPEVHTARLIVGADGQASKVRRHFGFEDTAKPGDKMLCVEHELDYASNLYCKPDEIRMFMGTQYAPRGGYAWAFPKVKSRKISIGLGGRLEKAKDLRERYWHWANHLDLDPRTAGPSKGGIVVCARPIKQDWPVHSSQGCVVLAGDAGRLTDPLTGGGIGTAAQSGKWVGDILKLGMAMVYDLHPARLARIALEGRLEQNYAAKEALVAMTDDDLNVLVRSLKAMSAMTTHDLAVNVGKYPAVAQAMMTAFGVV